MMSQGMVPALNELPFYLNRDFLTFISDMCDISLTIGGCLMCLFIVTKWKITNMDNELAEGNPIYMRTFLRNYLHIMIGYVCPILLGGLSILIIDKYFGLGLFF
jgi:NSS family neurotransmitter:Na+ symporter